MQTIRSILMLPLLVLVVSCLVPYRASSVDHIGLQGSTIVIPLTRDEAVGQVTARLLQRGFQRYEEHQGPNESLLVFYSGERRALSEVYEGPVGVETRSAEVGSRFGVRYIPIEGGTEVFFLGTPTLNGGSICSDADGELSAFEYWCHDSRVRSDWSGQRLITGREEANTVRSIIMELRDLIRETPSVESDGADSVTEAQVPAEASENVSSPSVDTSIADSIADGWEGLLGQAHAVYRAQWQQRTQPNGDNEICVQPTQTIQVGSDGAARPRRVCTAITDIVGMNAPGAGSLRSGEPAWVATAIGEGGEQILAIAGDTCGSDECATRTQGDLVQNLRCGQLDRLWREMPQEHLACSQDEDCVFLEAMCFATAVAETMAPAYREVIRRHGGRCLSPVAGACPPSRERAACQNSRCTAVLR